MIRFSNFSSLNKCVLFSVLHFPFSLLAGWLSNCQPENTYRQRDTWKAPHAPPHPQRECSILPLLTAGSPSESLHPHKLHLGTAMGVSRCVSACVSVCVCVHPAFRPTNKLRDGEQRFFFLLIVSLLKIRRNHFKRLPAPPRRDLEIFHQQREEKQIEVCTEFLLDDCCRRFSLSEWIHIYLRWLFACGTFLGVHYCHFYCVCVFRLCRTLTFW